MYSPSKDYRDYYDKRVLFPSEGPLRLHPRWVLPAWLRTAVCAVAVAAAASIGAIDEIYRLFSLSLVIGLVAMVGAEATARALVGPNTY